jgi:predicted amidophosphoribosyltransferase
MKARVVQVQKMSTQPGRVFSEHWECSSCAARVSQIDRFCRGCGASFTGDPVRV